MQKHPTVELLESLNGALIYALESATCLAVLYLAYHFFLRNERSFNYNRYYLLAAIILSVSFPLLEIDYNPETTPALLNSIHQVGNEVANEDIIEAEKVYNYTITAQSERPFLLWWEAILILYVTGVLIGIFKLLVQVRFFRDIIWYKRHVTRYKKEGYFLVNTEGTLPTFSFFKYLFWDDTAKLSKQEKQQILDHELVHIKEGHSYDVIGIELLKIFFWFNPLLYLYKLLLEEVHEYAADRKVANETSSSQYAQLLVSVVFKKMGLQHGSYFSKNQTVKRVNMLKTTKPINLVRLLIPVPLIALLFFIFSFEAKLSNQVLVDSFQYEVAGGFTADDQLPYPTEGVKGWQDFLQENITYPTEAKEANIQGQVLVSFTVNKQGNLQDLSFDQKIGYNCELEVFNALKKSGKWLPGLKSGEAIDTRVSVPINFKKS